MTEFLFWWLSSTLAFALLDPIPARIPPPELTIGLIELAFLEPGGGIAKRSIVYKIGLI